MPPKKERGKRAPTLVDVARVAGVSPITVSRALRAPGTVVRSTRDKVARAVAKTGYIPDAAAAQLAGGSSRLVAGIVPTLDAPYFVQGLRGLSDGVEAAGLSVAIGQTNYLDARGDELVRAMLAARPRGLVLFGADFSAAARAHLRGAGRPVVEAWEIVPDPIGLCVGFSHEAALRELTKAVLGAGRKAPVFGSRDPGQRRGAMRYVGFAAAVRAAGLAPRLVHRDAPTAFDAGVAVARALLDAREPLDALICAADTIAAGAIGEFRRAGVRVPDDVAVAGFGDLDFARVVHPDITTVRVPNREIGARAAEFVLSTDWRARLRKGPRTIDLGFELVARGSAPLANSR